MSTIRVGENESIDSALRRFKRKCSRDGIIGDLRRKEHTKSLPCARRRSRKLLVREARKTNGNTKACYEK